MKNLETESKAQQSKLLKKYESLKNSMANGLSEKKMVKLRWKEAEEKFTEKATESVKGSILLNKISSLQNIEPTAEEVDHRIKHISESYQVPFETVKESYEKNNMIESIESAITEKKVLDYIIEKAKITEVEPEPEVVDNENNN